MPVGNFFDSGNDQWITTDGSANQGGPDPPLTVKKIKRVKVYDAGAGVWRRAVRLREYYATGGVWKTLHTGLPATPTDTPPIAYLADYSVCSNPSPRTESWRFEAQYIVDVTYVGVYKLQKQFTRNGVGQGWADFTGTIDGSGNEVCNVPVTGSWSSGAPHGTLGTGAGYDTALWGIEARFKDIETGNVGPSNGTGGTNRISLNLPYC